MISHAKLNKMSDSHPPLDERIAILRTEGSDPNGRTSSTRRSSACRSTSDQLSASCGGALRRRGAGVETGKGLGGELLPTRPRAGSVPRADGVSVTIPPTSGRARPVGLPHLLDDLRYWNGNVFTDWTATWNGTRWVQSPVNLR